MLFLRRLVLPEVITPFLLLFFYEELPLPFHIATHRSSTLTRPLLCLSPSFNNATFPRPSFLLVSTFLQPLHRFFLLTLTYP
jgi:hypothetical protein